ncbi:MAG TPA: class IV adenylate cyclase [Anaerolineales bacterium]|nr:class IV adenylate cyclase [Anaerolineales bacterium]
MPANIEIKARVRNFAELRSKAEGLSDTQVEIIQQEDTFFNVQHGRLKLRVLAPDRGQLIFYQRLDHGGPKRSDYHLAETPEPDSLKRVLELAYGIRGVVKKTRYLYLAGQSRIHVDDVEGLGQFMELEVVLREGQGDAEGQAIAEGLMASLGVERVDLLEVAYMDLIESSAKSR